MLIVYGRAATFGFAPIDDAYYVWDNAFVKGGLSWAGIKYAFTTNQTANWHPLTWLSLMLDAQIGGVNAGVFHSVNVLLHAANSALLYLVAEGGAASWPLFLRSIPCTSNRWRGSRSARTY